MGRSRSFLMVGGLLWVASIAPVSAETRVEWQETATERIKIKYEDDVEVGRWTFPKRAPSPATAGSPVPNPFGARTGMPPGMAGKLGGPPRWPPGFAPPLPGSAGGRPGVPPNTRPPRGGSDFSLPQPGSGGAPAWPAPGGARPGFPGAWGSGDDTDEDDEGEDEPMDDAAAEAEAMEAARAFLLQQGIDPDAAMGGGGRGGPGMPGGYGGPAYPGGMQGGFEGMGSAQPPGFGGPQGAPQGWGGAPQGGPGWMQGGGPPPSGGFPGGGYPGMGGGGGQGAPTGGIENQLVGKWRRQYEGNYGVYVEVITVLPGGRFEKYEGSDIFVPGTQPGQGGYQHGGGGGESQDRTTGSFRIMGNQIQIQNDSGEAGTATFQMGPGVLVIDGKQYQRIQ